MEYGPNGAGQIFSGDTPGLRLHANPAPSDRYRVYQNFESFVRVRFNGDARRFDISGSRSSHKFLWHNYIHIGVVGGAWTISEVEQAVIGDGHQEIPTQ